ncbi:MAG: hypothetical protein HZC45_03655 [Deltaproteobacteria bacterium]|nr:hypothetical protein [Deltaproteobacteria bacterium]
MEVTVGSIKIKPIKVNHTVPSVGYIIKNNNSAFVYTGDTGITDKLWEEAVKEPNIRFVIAEVSFPNSMEDIANASKHMTPHNLGEVIRKFNRDNIKFFVSHIKPQYMKEIKAELKELNDLYSCISVLELNDVIEW